MTAVLELETDRPDDEVPEAPAKPDWKVALKRAWAKFSLDQCTDKAAALTYFSVQSLFPGLIAILSLLNIFGDGKSTTTKLIQSLSNIANVDPNSEGMKQVASFIDNVQTAGGGVIALIVGVGGALWSASGYVGGFGRALNLIYGVTEGRPAWKLRPWLLLITAIEVVLIIVIIVAIVTTGSVASEIGGAIGLGDQAVQVWDIVKWPFVAAIVVFIIGMLYWSTPNVQKAKRGMLSWGALVAFVVWVVASFAVLTYFTATNGSSYTKTYGAFAGVIMFLLWLWITNVAMLFGAELDAELLRTRQLKSGLPAEQVIQLPFRDDAGVDKAEEKHDEIVAQAIDLRRDSTGRNTASSLVAQNDTRTNTTIERTAQVKQPQSAQGQQQFAAIQQSREERRAQAMADAAHAREVRDRLERQEAKARAKAAAQAKREADAATAAEAAVSREEKWASVRRVRAQYAPEPSALREEIIDERAERRAQFHMAARQKSAAKSAEPKDAFAKSANEERKPVKTPPPSVLRAEIEQQQAERRAQWFAKRGR